MDFKIFWVFSCIAILPIVFTSENVDAQGSSYFAKVDEVINDAVVQFETEQVEKMKAGFTSTAKRSYKKTKLYERYLGFIIMLNTLYNFPSIITVIIEFLQFFGHGSKKFYISKCIGVIA